MSNKKILFVAVFLALLTTLAMNYYLEQVKKAATNVTTKKVVVANVNIPARTVITGDMVSVKDVPEEFVHPNAVLDEEQVIGFVSGSDISAGEQVLREKILRKEGNPVSLSYQVPLGSRAMSVPINEVTGVGGLVRPGDRVDVIGTIELETSNPASNQQTGPTQTTVAHVLLQNVEVLAVGDNFTPATNRAVNQGKEDAKNNQSDTGAKNVTLAIPADKMQALTLMLDHGKVTLALRSPLDQSRYDRPPFDDTQFLKK
ncbi:Flp pilus assembly protein CpaB [Thermincola potens]|uniref:Flp pilus assembly protein CpaB n=1 Tax=Thermincola potens (strain JR) TaxID=635013 RepID=D5XCW7_THEPJ|nr:Flp pilus assembly protein CpaB [Thermincola potens]ADG83643.1 Flp pilus assembly protein CpaB [Thermincola potens JR]